MPAYFESGFSVRQPMWHGKGIVLGEYPEDWSDAREKAGLTWEPVEHPAWVMRDVHEFELSCFICGCEKQHAEGCTRFGTHGAISQLDRFPDESVLTADGKHVFVVDETHKQVIRSDNKRVLGSNLSSTYSLISHGRQAEGASMEQIVDAFKDVDGKVKFETAGSVADGKQVWALMYLDEPFQIPGDSSETLPFIALLNRHDGSGACKLTRTSVRVVCWNTYQMASAEGDRTGLQYSFRHTGDVESRIEEAKLALDGLRVETAEYREMCTELMKLNVSDAQLNVYLQEFLPNPAEHGEQVSERVQSNVERARALFKSLYSDSITAEGITGTGYGLLQASTEYLDHARAYRTHDSYMGRSILHGDPLKARVLTQIHAACK